MSQENSSRLMVQEGILILHAPTPGSFGSREMETENCLKRFFYERVSLCRLRTIVRIQNEIDPGAVSRLMAYMQEERLNVLVVAGTQAPHFLALAMLKAGRYNYQVLNFATPCSELDDLWHKLAEAGFIS